MNREASARKPSVMVMMATYNGSEFISEQIDSILSQDDVDVTLRICDDCSTDCTSEICREYVEKHDNVVFTANQKNVGLAKNFMSMVYSDAADGFDYYAFSDQDDVWLPNKLIHAISMLRAEASEGPALYYSDVENVNRDLSGGTREYYAWTQCAKELIAVLTINWASGCTMVFNSELRSWVLGYDPCLYPRIHDGWLHLVAMISGTVIADLDNSYIKRRISGENQVGQRDLESTESLLAVSKRWSRLFEKNDHCQTTTAKLLLDGYGTRLESADLALIRQFASMPYSIGSRFVISRELLKCSFPTKSMACSFALKALLNRM